MFRFLLLSSLALLSTGCFQPAESNPAKVAPAKVEKLPLETEIGRITLTPQAEQRLGIKLDSVTQQNVQRRRTLGGDVLIPVGKSIVVSAPFSGTVIPFEDSKTPSPGQHLETGEGILTLAPILTPERDVPTPAEQVQMANARATLLAALAVAQGDIERSRVEVDAAKIAFDRAEQLFADRAGSKRAVDDAQAMINVAQSLLDAARVRESQLSKLVIELDKPPSERTAESLSIAAPQAGVLRTLSVTPGQAVTAGAILFEIVDTDRMWIRVPVYVEMLSKIDVDQDAQIVALGAMLMQDEPASSSSEGQTPAPVLFATPVEAPPSADPLSSSVDLYFECPNPTGALRPGQRVGVQLALKGKEQGLTVAQNAILYDIYGGTWVYVQQAEHVFERQRVLIQYVLDDRVVLAEGPAVGTQIVTDGVAELFGTEFGAGK